MSISHANGVPSLRSASSTVWSAFGCGSLRAVRIRPSGESGVALACGFHSQDSAQKFADRCPSRSVTPTAGYYVVVVSVSGQFPARRGEKGPGWWMKGGIPGCSSVALAVGAAVAI